MGTKLTSKSQKPKKSPKAQSVPQSAQTLPTLPDKKEQERTTRKKALFLKNFLKSKGVLGTAAKATRISRQQVHEWRTTDAAFAQLYNEAEVAACEFVESEMMKQIKDGNTTLTIFYLVNRSKGRWENIQKVEHKPDDTTSAKIDKLLENMAGLMGLDK